MTLGTIIGFSTGIIIVGVFIGIAYWQYRKLLRESKNYERGLKMVPLKIHLPPSSEDIESGNRDERDIADETISQAEVLYNVIASTATRGFKSRFYGQRHISFEVLAFKGVIDYYVAVPMVLLDVIHQAVTAAYPSARLEEVDDPNIFSEAGKISGTIGGEFTLKKSFVYPIATYQESKRDAMRALLNALAVANRDDGIGIQLLIRPAMDGWTKSSKRAVEKIKKDRAMGKKTSASFGGGNMARDIMESLWKAPSADGRKEEHDVTTQLTSLEQKEIEAIEAKVAHPGYEVLVRVIASSTTSARSQVLMKNVVAAFALFDSPSNNGFKFVVTKNVEEFVTSFIFRFFPQELNRNVLNSVELATIFHLPDQGNIPTSQLKRQASKQVDGPRELSTEGFLLGYNIYRDVKKEIRLGTNDRRRHTYIIGQTGTGKSKLLENLALQDMLDGRGFAFVDPHGDSAEALLGMVPKERVEDVIYFNPGEMDNPVGLNLFEFDNPDQRDFLIQEAIGMLYRLYDPGHTGIIGPRYEHWFRHAAITLMSDPTGTSFIDIPQVFNDDAFAKEKLKYVTDQTTLDFWNKEMAQTSDYHKSEMLGWFVSKFGAFQSNEMMRNIIGQTKSGFNLRKIMDEQKILLVNLSKGKTGELNSQLLGMIFVMKFQAAAMGRADIPESDRKDFALYVDEFQNFATDSFESILSEARKYRLNLILANQFISQLTDKIREAILGNVGTVISARIGMTDAELMVKKFTPTFDAEDLTRLPNYEGVVVAQMNGMPSHPFSMAFPPPLGYSNPQLADALKRLSAAKFGKPRQEVERDIFKRLRAGDDAREAKKREFEARLNNNTSTSSAPTATSASTGSSFLDEWLAKRKQPQNGGASRPVSSASALAQPKNNQPVDKEAVDGMDHNTTRITSSQTDRTVQEGVQKLKSMQDAGLGSDIKTVSANHQAPAAPDDAFATESAMQQVMDDDVMKKPTTEMLKVSRPETHNTGGDITASDDEILIDLRGNLSHRAAKPDDSK